MKVLDPGHDYALDNLSDPKGGSRGLRFFKDPALHDGEGYSGTSCQEVVRALINRVQVLDREKPWNGNAQIIQRLREVIALFEMRALMRKVEKGMKIERKRVGDDGHLIFEEDV